MLFEIALVVTLQLAYSNNLKHNRRTGKSGQEIHSTSGHKLNKKMMCILLMCFRKTLQWQSFTVLYSPTDLLLCVQTAADCRPHDAPLPTAVRHQCGGWQINFNFIVRACCKTAADFHLCTWKYMAHEIYFAQLYDCKIHYLLAPLPKANTSLTL